MPMSFISNALSEAETFVASTVKAGVRSIFNEKYCMIFQGEEKAGKSTLLRCLEGKEFCSSYHKTINQSKALVSTEDVEWTLWDTVGGNVGIREKEALRNQIQGNKESAVLTYVFDAEKCCDSLPKEIFYGIGNCISESKERGFVPLIIGTKGDKLNDTQRESIKEKIRQMGAKCEIFDMTHSETREKLVNFMDGSVKK